MTVYGESAGWALGESCPVILGGIALSIGIDLVDEVRKCLVAMLP